MILKLLQFRKVSSSPRKTEQIKIFLRRLECISRDLKVLSITLYSRKSVFIVFWRKPSLVPRRSLLIRCPREVWARAGERTPFSA